MPGPGPQQHGRPGAPANSEHIAGSVAGMGATEVPRRELTQDEVVAIVQREIDERREAALTYERARQDTAAEQVRREADVLTRILGRRSSGAR